MGDNGAPADMAAILTAIQEQLVALGGRMDRMEQPRRRDPVRDAPLPRHQPQPDPEEDDMPELEEDVPHQQQRQPRQHNPPDRYNNPRPRDPIHRGREREDELARQNVNDVKLNAPTFAGKVNPEAYLDWERRMEHIFDYYRYNEPKKVALAAAQLTDHALFWWDREVSERRRHHYEQITTWTTMKFNLRKRYVPPHFHRDLQKRFCQLKQGNKLVEEYFEEFEHLWKRLELEDTEETLMAQFIDGLQDRIARKVERQPYHDMSELLHIAMQAEQHIKRKITATSRNRSSTTWTPQPPKVMDKGKAVDTEPKYKKPLTEQPKGVGSEQGKFTSASRTRDITCFKCQGRGHMMRDCPNRRTMVITPTGEYESEDEPMEEQSPEPEEEVAYPDTGELLVIRRAMSALMDPETIQRENIFHTRCTVQSKVCSLIIDGGSCANVASKFMVDKLGLKKTKHPRPYKLKWLNDETILKIAEQTIIPFSVGKYQDEVLCDVVPMEAGHLLL